MPVREDPGFVRLPRVGLSGTPGINSMTGRPTAPRTLPTVRSKTALPSYNENGYATDRSVVADYVRSIFGAGPMRGRGATPGSLGTALAGVASQTGVPGANPMRTEAGRLLAGGAAQSARAFATRVGGGYTGNETARLMAAGGATAARNLATAEANAAIRSALMTPGADTPGGPAKPKAPSGMDTYRASERTQTGERRANSAMFGLTNQPIDPVTGLAIPAVRMTNDATFPLNATTDDVWGGGYGGGGFGFGGGGGGRKQRFNYGAVLWRI